MNTQKMTRPLSIAMMAATMTLSACNLVDSNTPEPLHDPTVVVTAAPVAGAHTDRPVHPPGAPLDEGAGEVAVGVPHQ
jgi:hypothetical protein